MDVAAYGDRRLAFDRQPRPLEVVARPCWSHPSTNVPMVEGQEPHQQEPQLPEHTAHLVRREPGGRHVAPEAAPPGEGGLDGLDGWHAAADGGDDLVRDLAEHLASRGVAAS